VSIYWRPAQLERLLDQKSTNRKAKTIYLHYGSKCDSTLPKLVQRHCYKSSWKCIRDAFHLQHQNP